MIVACLALLVALGGTSVAAVSQLVPRNSVGTAQLTRQRGRHREGAEQRDHEREGAEPLAPRGRLRGWTDPGRAGGTGRGRRRSGSRRDLRARSRTHCPPGERSAAPTTWAAPPPRAGGLANTSVSFVYALAAAPAVHFVRQGTAAPAQCPGNATFPQATAGNLCVYETERLNTAGGSGERGQPLRSDDLHQLPPQPAASTASEPGR